MTELSAKHLKMLSCKVQLNSNMEVNFCNQCSTSVQTVRAMANYDPTYECHSYVLDNFTADDYSQLSAALDRINSPEGEEYHIAGGIQTTRGQAIGGNSCYDCGAKISSTECSYCRKCCTGCSIH